MDCMRVFFENPRQAYQDHIWNAARLAQPKAVPKPALKAIPAVSVPVAKNAAARGAAAAQTMDLRHQLSIDQYARIEAERLARAESDQVDAREQEQMAAALAASWQTAVADPRMTDDGFTSVTSRKKGKREGGPPDDVNQFQVVQWIPNQDKKDCKKDWVIKPKRKGKIIPKVYDNPHAIDFILNVTKSLSASQLWADSGCRKSVGGTDSHKTIQALYRKLGMKPEKVEKVNHFSFGNGAPATSTVTWMYPIFIGGSYKGDIAIAEVPGVCPILFSINMMIEWKIDLLNSEHLCSSPTMGISV